VRPNYLYIGGIFSLTRHRVPPAARTRTSRSSSIKSPTRRKDLPPPRTTSGSCPARSVHCQGTRQTAASSARNRTRLPCGVYRIPRQTHFRPPSGWNGCVTRTRCVPGTGPVAFWAELQTIGTGNVWVAGFEDEVGGDDARGACLAPRRGGCPRDDAASLVPTRSQRINCLLFLIITLDTR